MQKNYSSDAPITDPSQDRFSRWPFAKRIADVIAERDDPSSIVIGLYGAWGDGKTSVLNFIQKALEVNEDVICIKFNPWRYGSEEQLLLGFFLDIAEALDTEIFTSEDKIKDIVKKLAPATTGAFGFESVGKGISQFISGPTLDELRDRIEKKLDEAKKRILVLADDIDRLEKSEIYATFRLVKLTADFKYTSYILAFDEEVVASALQDRYGTSSGNAGHAFLEKIIQVPLRLPPIDGKSLKDFCFESVDQALELASIELNDQQIQEFVRNFTVGFDRQLTTPRKAKLYGNILMFSLPILKGEVNPVDLMLIEGIRVFFPSLNDLIRSNQDKFAGTFLNSVYGNSDNDKERVRTLIDQAISSLDSEEVAGIKSLLTSLFPRLQAVYRNTFYGNEWEGQWQQAQRVCSSAYFNRYFSYAVPHDDIPDSVIVNIIQLSANGSEEQISLQLHELLSRSNAGRAIKKLRIQANMLPAESSIALSVSISQNADKYLDSEGLFNPSNPFTQAAILISDLIQNVSEIEAREELAVRCIKSSSRLEFALEIFHWLKREDKERPEKEGFSQTSITKIASKLVGIIELELNAGVDITSQHSKACNRILYFLTTYGERNKVEKYLQELFSLQSGAIFRLFDSYTPTAWEIESGISHKSDFERSQYDNIVAVIDPAVIETAIIAELGELPPISDTFPRDGEKNRDILLSKQFLWLHWHVSKENSELPSEERT